MQDATPANGAPAAAPAASRDPLEDLMEPTPSAASPEPPKPGAPLLGLSSSRTHQHALNEASCHGGATSHSSKHPVDWLLLMRRAGDMHAGIECSVAWV